jgi:hypothetical protein
MRKERVQEDSQLTSPQSSSLSGSSSRLIERGLKALEQSAVSDEQIKHARSTQKEFVGLNDNVIRIALERPPQWEYLMFFQLLTDEVSSYESLRHAVELGIAPKTAKRLLTLEESHSWGQVQLSDLMELVQETKTAFVRDFQIGVGPAGKPGDPVAIALAARRLGLLYKQILDFSVSFATTRYDPIFNGVYLEVSQAIGGFANQFQAWLRAIQEAISAPDTRTPLDLTPKFDLNLDRATVELGKLMTLLRGTLASF